MSSWFFILLYSYRFQSLISNMAFPYRVQPKSTQIFQSFAQPCEFLAIAIFSLEFGINTGNSVLVRVHSASGNTSCSKVIRL